jgi:hypothetical protein
MTLREQALLERGFAIDGGKPHIKAVRRPCQNLQKLD